MEIVELSEAATYPEMSFRQMADLMPQIVWTVAQNGKVDYFNSRWWEFTGLTRGDMNWLSVLHPEDLFRCQQIWERAEMEGHPYEIEYRFREGKTGTYRWFLSRALPIRDKDGKVVRWFGTCTDIDDQKKASEALALSQSRLRLALASTQMATWDYSIHSKEFSFSETFAELFGRTNGASMISPVDFLNWIHPEDRAEFHQSVLKVIQGVENAGFKEYRVIWPDGGVHWLSVRSRLHRNSAGEPVLFHGVVVDVTQLRETECQLQGALRIRDEFLGIASHELRTPITAIKLQMDLMQKVIQRNGIGRVSPLQWRKLISTSVRQLQSLDRLVSDLLEVSKIVHGKVRLRRETFDLGELAREVAFDLVEAGVPLDLKLETSLQENVIGCWDRQRLRQVITNLLSNAIKYGEHKPVLIAVELDGDRARVVVEDHGIGIPKENLQTIFDRFERAENGRHLNGLGLGLFITHRLVQEHQGRISVESVLGEGSKFTVILPLFAEA